MVRVTIIGTGDEAHALAHSFQINNCQWSGNTLEVTKPEIERKGGIFHSTGVPIGSFEDSVRNADVIILAIPARILKSFVSEHFSALKDKIVVDTTKSSNRGEDLDTLLAVTNVRYVKAFHDINAVDLLLSHPFDKTKVVSTMCSRYPDALAVVKSFAENSLGFDIKSIPYEAYSQITLRQESFGEEWLKALRVMSVVFILAEVYAVVR